MPKRLFEDVLVGGGPLAARTRYSLPVSVAGHAAALASLALVSMTAGGALPTPRLLPTPVLTIPVVRAANTEAPLPRLPAARPAAPRNDSLSAPRPVVPVPAVPVEVPNPDAAPTDSGFPGPDDTVPSLGPPGFGPSSPDGPGGDSANSRASTAPIRVSVVDQPRKLRHVDPVYPEIARMARVQGVVELDCVITPEGRVSSVRVLHGNPLLDAAAVQAVQQWVYTPTRVSGVPVAVILTVHVRFTLS